MAGDTGARADGRASPRAEAAEIRAWRLEKVRRWPRRARILAMRIVAVCVCALLALVVLEQVISFTTTSTQGVSRSPAPHQM
jgi:energy-coupling factor transporter transmembrane protein EcfT